MEDFVQQVSEEFKNIFFIKGANNGRYPYSHSLLIEDYLIDTGISSRLLRKLKRNFQINSVLLSHWHEDHISGNRIVSNSKFHIHYKDKELVENIDKIYEFYGIANPELIEDFYSLMVGFNLKNTKIDKIIDDNDLLKIGNDSQLKVIYTPGHTAGHCVFLETNSKIAFLGDIDLTRFPYYGNIDANLIEFEESIEKLKKLDIKIAATGHRGPIEGVKKIKEELNNYKLIIHKRDERILSNLSEKTPITPLDLKNKNLIYKRYTYKDFEIIAEVLMIEKHFEKLVESNSIIPENGGFTLT